MAKAKRDAVSYEERRRQLLEAATIVFARGGYLGSRVGDIAKEAGVAYGLVYHYFKNKEAILNALFQENWGLVLKVVTDAHEQGGTLRSKLEGIASFLIEAWRLRPELVEVVMLEVVRSPKFLEEANLHAFLELLGRLEEIFAYHQTTGEVRSEVDPKLSAILFLGQLEVLLTGFVARQFLANDDPTLLDRSRVAVVETMLRGVST